ncbi:MAG: carbon-nitrogen hydrolase family protein [Candidatus Uhrbacteria bacterium]|nr:carbon-nitrogen hydrolase family protein [Candidatus Uhrbacteria bacterium]
MKVKIAVVQFKSQLHEPEINLKRAEDFIKNASRSKTNIIVFPENFITGPVALEKQYWDPSKTYCQKLQIIAKKYKIDIVTGSIVENTHGKAYGTSYYIDSRGQILLRYRKNHLWHSEKGHLLPDNKTSVANTKYGKVGIVICWDLVFPDVWQKMMQIGAEIIFCPSYWSYSDAGKGILYNNNSEIEFVNSMTIARAFENEAAVIFCNAANNKQPRERSLIGRSQIALPFIGPIKRLNHNREEMFITEIDTIILDVAEDTYQIKKDTK